MSRPRVELDDRSLVDILSRVGDAKQLGKCSLVCRRWRALRWAVSRLQFHFKVSSWEDLRRKELVIAGVLRRTKKEAPGCLKHLKVSLQGAAASAQFAACYWLPYAAESVTELELDFDKFLCNMSVWSSLSFFHDLQSLTLEGGYYVDSFLPMANESPFRSLRKCCISGTAATAELLEAIATTCPNLEHLGFKGFSEDEARIEVVNSSVEHLALLKGVKFLGRRPEQCVILSLDTPQLNVLKAGIGKHPMEIRIVSTENLRKLVLFDSCALHSETHFGNLKSLTITGKWTTDKIFAVLELTPTVTELILEKLDVDEMRLGDVCMRLPNLKTLEFDGSSLKSFSSDTGPYVFEDITAHFWVYMLEGVPGLSVLKNLLRVNRVLMLVVHYTLEDIRNKDNEWRFLLSLELLFPGRIKFKHEFNLNS